jgi:hypothetical protein
LSGPAFLKCGGNKVNTSGDIKIYIQVFWDCSQWFLFYTVYVLPVFTKRLSHALMGLCGVV